MVSLENVTVKQYHFNHLSTGSMDGGAKLAPRLGWSGSLFARGVCGCQAVFPNSPPVKASSFLGVASGRRGTSSPWADAVYRLSEDKNKDGQCDKRGPTERIGEYGVCFNTIRIKLFPRIRVRVKPPDRSAAKDGGGGDLDAGGETDVNGA